MAALQGFEVSIRHPNGTTCIVLVRPDMNIGDVKQVFAERASIDPNQFRLVFAGQQLNETSTLSSFGLMGFSTLHCISKRPGMTVEVAPNQSMDTIRSIESKLADIGLEQTEGMGVQTGTMPSTPPKSGSQNNFFFIYCNDVCKEMKPGKLRVRCGMCKDESFLLSRGPDNWADVLTKNKIQGTCNNPNCQGTRFAEFFFKCGGHEDRTGQLNQYMALHMIKANTIDVICASCADVSDTVVRFDCNHCMCVDCFSQYCQVNVDQRTFTEVRGIGYTIECPDKCDQSYVKEIHHFQLMGKEKYEHYKNFAAEEFVLQMGGVLCPAVGCGAGLLLEDNNRRIQCPTCNHVFCKNCKSDYHQGDDCTAQRPANQPASAETHQFDQQRLQQARWDDESAAFIRNNERIKQCPNCHTQIEKNEGCNHMICSRCRFNFCWLCLVEWGSNCQGSHWFGHTAR